MRRGLVVAVAALAVSSCTGDNTADSRSPTSTSQVGETEAPADCAGPGRVSTEEFRQADWVVANEQLADAEDGPVWLGFSRTLSVAEASQAMGSLTAHAALLVYEERQGTYAKVHGGLPDVQLESPEFGALTAELLRPSSEKGGLFEPVDAQVRAGSPPIAGLLVSGDDLATVLAQNECLIHSMAPGGADGPVTAPSIEP
jgi:hypothetical protein